MVRGAMVAMGAAGCLLAAGCSDGGSGDGAYVPPPFPPEARSFDALDAAGTTIADQRDSLPFTDPSNLPTSGGASYTGVMGLVLTPEERPDTPAELDGVVLLGDMRMNVEFGDDSLSAMATNFVTDSDVDVPGALTFDGGGIDRSANPNGAEWTFGAGNAEGELALPDGESYRPVEGEIAGDFNGATAGYAGGAVDLTLANTSEGLLGPLVYADGIFDLERD